MIHSNRLMEDVRAISAFGEKLPGNPAARSACNYITARLEELSIQHVTPRFDAFIGWPVESKLFVDAADLCISGCGIAFGPDTGVGGVTGQIVDCGETIRGRDLKNRIALVDGMPRYAMCVEAARAGALALIAVSSGAQRHFISAASLYGPPTQLEDLALLPPIPALQISKPDGDTLRNLKDATVTTVTRTRMEWRPVCMPVAHIPGREPGFLLLGAHYCTWHQGSTDNVAGVALLLELARRYAAGPKPRYGLRFAWWTGHEQGNYAGSSWYADRHWNELHEHAIGYMNVDIVGSRGATTKAIRNTSAELISFISNAVEALSEPLDSADQVFLQSALKRLDSHIDYRRPAHHSDQSFLGIGLPSLQVSSFIPSASPDHLPNSGLPWWWQTEHDTPDQCDPEVLLADTDLHHALVERLVNSAVLPFDFTLVADDFITSLGEYESAAPDFSELKALLGLAQDFRNAAISFHSALPKDADAIFLRASRLLNPVLYHTVSGYFPEHGRALRLLPGLAGTLALDRLDPPGAQMARVQLRRQCNRIEHALREVIKLFEGGRDGHIHGADNGHKQIAETGPYSAPTFLQDPNREH